MKLDIIVQGEIGSGKTAMIGILQSMLTNVGVEVEVATSDQLEYDRSCLMEDESFLQNLMQRAERLEQPVQVCLREVAAGSSTVSGRTTASVENKSNTLKSAPPPAPANPYDIEPQMGVIDLNRLSFHLQHVIAAFAQRDETRMLYHSGNIKFLIQESATQAKSESESEIEPESVAATVDVSDSVQEQPVASAKNIVHANFGGSGATPSQADIEAEQQRNRTNSCLAVVDHVKQDINDNHDNIHSVYSVIMYNDNSYNLVQSVANNRLLVIGVLEAIKHQIMS